MSGHLIVLAGATPDAPASWWLYGDDGQVLQQGAGDGLADLAALAELQPRLVSLIVPGQDVLALKAVLPARSDAQARAAAPFAVEEQLASRLDTAHVALGPRRAGDERMTLVIDRARFAAWRDAMNSAGLGVRHILPDYAAASCADGDAHMVALDGRLVVALVDGGGFTVEADWAAAVMGPLLLEAGVTRLWVHGVLPDWAGAALPDDVPRIAGNPAGAAMLADHIAQAARRSVGTVVNLLQGPFAPAPAWRKLGKDLRAAAALALCLMLGLLVLQLTEARHDIRAADARLAQAEALFRASFPDVKTLVNPRAQMQAQINRLGGQRQGDFLRLAGMLTAALAEVEQVRLDTLRYDAERGGLSASLHYRAFGDVEAVRAAVARQGGVLEEGGSRQNGGVIAGDIMVRAR